MVTLCIPTLNSFAELDRCIQAAMNGTVVPEEIHIIDNSCGKLERDYANIYVPERNLGVAGSWNRFMAMNKPNMLIVNDDIVLHRHAIERFLDVMQGDAGFVCCAGHDAFSCFALKHSVWQQIGPFDEKFYPGYFEDNDYSYRMKLAGVAIHTFPEHLYDHVHSTTLRNYTQEEKDRHPAEFEACRNYFAAKWGGSPGNETYTLPFNGGEQQ